MEFALFFIAALVAVASAVAMLVTRHAVHSALFLLLNFAAVAVLFLLLQAPFLFAIQLSIYAGAIMVLFLFVVMLLGAEHAEMAPDELAWQRPLAIGLGVVLLAEMVMLFFGSSLGTTTDPKAAVSTTAASFGSPVELGRLLFTHYLLPFEVAGIILLVAIVGVVVLHRGRTIADGASQAVPHEPPAHD